MIIPEDWNRLARFAAGECTADEADACTRWIDESAERQEALAFIKDADHAARVGRPEWDTVAAWERFAVQRSARGGRERPPLRLRPVDSIRRAGRWSRRVAAAAVVVLSVGALSGGWQLWQMVAPRLEEGARAVGPMRERVTKRGERATFRLPDGSRVILAPASRLRYPASLTATRGRRDVYLDGQALFDVTHDARRPFVIHAASGITEDLGTKFTVQEYPGDTTVQVVVAEGSVELRERGLAKGGVLLRPGQRARLSRNGDVVVWSNVDIARELAWTDGTLVFDDTPLRDALPALSRWYNMEFLLGDSTIGAQHLSAELAGGAIMETLELLSSALDLDYRYHNKTVTFLPRR